MRFNDFAIIYTRTSKANNHIISCIKMASEAYKEKTNLKKQQQADELWTKVSEEPRLAGLLDLHNKIKDLEKKREKNREYIE